MVRRGKASYRRKKRSNYKIRSFKSRMVGSVRRKAPRLYKKIKAISRWTTRKVLNARTELKRVYEPSTGLQMYPTNANFMAVTYAPGSNIPTTINPPPLSDPQLNSYAPWTLMYGIYCGADNTQPSPGNNIPLNYRAAEIIDASIEPYQGIKSLAIWPILPQTPSSAATSGTTSYIREGKKIWVHRASIKMNLKIGVVDTGFLSNQSGPYSNQLLDQYCNEAWVLQIIPERDFADLTTFEINAQLMLSAPAFLANLRRGTVPANWIHEQFHVRIRKIKKCKFTQPDFIYFGTTGESENPNSGLNTQTGNRQYKMEMGQFYGSKGKMWSYANDANVAPDMIPFMVGVIWYGCANLDVQYYRTTTWKEL